MSKKVYCLAQFMPKAGCDEALFRVLQALEPDTLREDGCIQYVVTRHIPSPFAEGDSYPIVFNEIWSDLAAFESHCQRSAIQQFFETQCVADSGLVDKWNVCIYSDEPHQYDAPRLAELV
ncbi:putative quinol monooxygenase [Motiliproteus sediminis]|uniref:putative quinol monooxygenase n=1 Tax=Motiliproteus sediminis TaxID=1468178 RepID=UPI001AEFFC83|nr:putative quinol monooxygenase [Motiliproteus sediminis]